MTNYTLPRLVNSPRASVKEVHAILDLGEEDWSAALLNWDGVPACGLRWNGWSQGEGNKPHPGVPQSRGLPTWFVLPSPLVLPVLETIAQIGPGGPDIDEAEARRLVEQAIADFSQRATQAADGEQRLRQLVRSVVLEMRENGEI